MKQGYILLLLFMSSFGYTQKPQDCETAFPICSKGTYHFDNLKGPGNKVETFDQLSCFSSKFSETNSAWLKFEIATPGILTFIIQPEQTKDDLDFFLFSSTGNCQAFEEIRCMASGDSFTNPNSKCLGETGLDIRSVDQFESTGCKYKDDNFLKYLQVESGEYYYLLINNFDSSKGFSFSIEGTAQLRAQGKCSKYEYALHIVDVFPNPAENELHLNFTSPAHQKTDVHILDLAGRKVAHHNVSPIRGENQITLPVEQLQSGSYLINLKQAGHSSAKLFVKK